MENLTAEDTTYAPQSPDLTAAEFEPHPQHREYRGSVSGITPFTPTSETIKTPFGQFPPSLPSAHSQYVPPVSQPQISYSNNAEQYIPASPVQQQHFNPYFAKAAPLHPQEQPYYGPPVTPVQQAYLQHYQFPPQLKQEEGYGEEIKAMPAVRGGKKAKREAEEDVENNAPGVREGIEVRTKFPVARIKRIMQADEDVGKVAQVTPVAVSKALELFMISLVTKAATQAKDRGSKRVLAAHLKQAILNEPDQFDYLQDIVSKVAEAPAKNADKQEDSDEAMENGSGSGAAAGAGKKKRAAAASRRKRKSSDDEF